ncbi:hypothetical protein LTS15_011046 [Exophiala xenobiotica]|nr:hypothetical protein LTS15_011046 [Exophiala xenobiotica]
MEQQKVYIAVMGVTGAGKSSFIKTATGMDVEIGHTFMSCTTEVNPIRFAYDNFDITLIDTPGFNDTTRTETEVLRDIADWLDITYRNPPKIKLSGILYVQSITDNKMYGSSLRNLKMFRDLCGDEPMKNVIFITTGWKLCNDSGRGEIAIQKENQLATERLFWEPMLRRGAQMARFEDTKQSAVEIVMKLVPKRPIVLQIQHELVDERKDLIDTTAGATVNAEIKRLEAKYRQQLVEIQEEMAQALKSQDKEHQEALEETKAKIEYLRDEARRAQDILNYERRNADRRHELEIEDLRTALETAQQTMLNEKQQLQAEAAAQRYEDQMQFEQLVAQLQVSMTKVREEDRRRIQAEILKVQKQKQKSGRVKTLLLSLLPAVGNVVLSALGFGVLGSASPFSGLLSGDDTDGNSTDGTECQDDPPAYT